MAESRLCVDIDNVIGATDEIMRRVIREVTNGRVNLAYDQVRDFKYQRCKDDAGECISDQEWHTVHDEFSKPQNLRMIEPIESARESLARLADHFVLHLVTSRLQSARGATVQWLEDNFPGLSYGLHFVRHGEKHLTMGQLTAAIEDDYDQAVAFAKRGVRAFLMRHPWNDGRPLLSGMARYDGWRNLTDGILKDLPTKIAN